jgi:hypothetical protein
VRGGDALVVGGHGDDVDAAGAPGALHDACDEGFPWMSARACRGGDWPRTGPG